MSVRCNFAEVEAAAAEPVWHELQFGVRLKLRAQTGLVEASIQAQIGRDLYAFNRGEDVVSKYGFNEEEAGVLADEDIASGFALLLQNCIRGVMLIEAWNLIDERDEPIPITLQTVRAFFHLGPFPGAGPILMAGFQRICDLPAMRLEAEKKGFAPLPNGDTAGAQTTALDAEASTRDVPSAAKTKSATAARKTQTGRKRKTA